MTIYAQYAEATAITKVEVMEVKERVGTKLSVKTSEEQTIPKHRFDCINLCLKETKEALRERTAEVDALRERVAELDKLLLDAKVETALALHWAKNLTAVKALIDFNKVALDCNGIVSGLEEQITLLKESQSYLFESREELAYILVPVKSDDPLNKPITDYVANRRKEK